MALNVLLECITTTAALPCNLMEKCIGDIVLGVLISGKVLVSQGRDLYVVL